MIYLMRWNPNLVRKEQRRRDSSVRIKKGGFSSMEDPPLYGTLFGVTAVPLCHLVRAQEDGQRRSSHS